MTENNNTLKALIKIFENSKEKHLIAENEKYKLYRPQNSWEMNYQLKHKGYKITYLIDVDDFSEIDNIKDFDEVKSFAWKTVEG